jgi:hypothetical protein
MKCCGMGIKLETEIKSIGRVEAVRIANITLRWCKRVLGVNKRKRTLVTWYVRKGCGEEDTCGEYDATDNEVIIHWDNCIDVKELMETCIHEWTHQNQPILTKYDKYPGCYSRNPYERQARYAEKKWLPICWKELQSKINKVNDIKIKKHPN